MDSWLMQGAALLVGASGLLAWAQPGGPAQTDTGPRGGAASPQRERGPASVSDETNPDTLRARLERRLDDTQRFTARLEQAIEMLDEGGTVDDALGALRGNDAPLFDGDRRRELADRWRDRRDARGPRRPLDQSERARMLELIASELPELDAHLSTLSGDDARAEETVLLMLAPRLREVMEAAEREPELARLRLDEIRTGFQAIRLGRTVREAQRNGTLSERPELREQIAQAMRTQGEARIAVKAYELDRLRERIARLESELDREREALDARTAAMIDRLFADN